MQDVTTEQGRMIAAPAGSVIVIADADGFVDYDVALAYEVEADGQGRLECRAVTAGSGVIALSARHDDDDCVVGVGLPDGAVIALGRRFASASDFADWVWRRAQTVRAAP